MTCLNYDATIIGWANNPLTPSGLNLGAYTLKYSSAVAQTARITLTTTKGWTIFGDNLDINCAALLNNNNFEALVNKIVLYPNPTQNIVNIELKDLTAVQLQIIDINGRVLEILNLNNSKNTINLEQLQAGIYLFQINTNEGTTTTKVIKN